MESDSDNKVNGHLCSPPPQKNLCFSVTVAQKFDVSVSVSSGTPAQQPSRSSASHDPCAFQAQGNSLGGEINIRNANEMHIQVAKF